MKLTIAVLMLSWPAANAKKPRVHGIYRVWEGGVLELSKSTIQFG
jgi:hypothetical protein